MSSGSESDEQKDETFNNPLVLDKYRQAAQVANAALAAVVTACVDGAKILDLCAKGDKAIHDSTKKSKAKDKGIAFPTCISVNHVVGHYSAEADDGATVKKDDVVKIDLGVHIDGYIALVAHTHVVGTTPEAPLKGRAADVVCAAHIAAELVLRTLKAGVSSNDIPPIIQAVADAYKVSPVEAVLSHEMERFIIDGSNVIMNKVTEDQKSSPFEIKAGTVYAIDIVMSSGRGQPKEAERKPTVYKRQPDTTYQLKTAASRKVYSEIQKKFPSLPFSLRAVEEERARFGLVEIEKHDMVVPYPILVEKEGEFVAQFKFTCLVAEHGALRLTQLPSRPHVFSDNNLTDATLKARLEQPALTSISKKAAKRAGADAGGVAKKPTPSETSTTTTTSASGVAPMDTN